MQMMTARTMTQERRERACTLLGDLVRLAMEQTWGSAGGRGASGAELEAAAMTLLDADVLVRDLGESRRPAEGTTDDAGLEAVVASALDLLSA